MRATIVTSIEDATEPGSVEIRHYPAVAGDDKGKLAGLAITCPGCGEKSWLPVREHNTSDHDWQLVSLDPIEISPSVFHTKENGGCSWHGYLRKGEWKSC